MENLYLAVIPAKAGIQWLQVLRAREEIISHFRISYSGHLRPLLNRKILEIVLLFLRSCSIVTAKSDPNLSAKPLPQNETISLPYCEIISSRALRDPCLRRDDG